MASSGRLHPERKSDVNSPVDNEKKGRHDAGEPGPSTIKDVAGLAGVSTATVSRVMNDAGYVSCSTRSKVLNAISRLKYCPNVYAAELRRNPRKHETEVSALTVI